MIDPLLEQTVTLAAQRLNADLHRDLPSATSHLERHLKRVPSLTHPTTTLVPEAFPSLALPHWMTPSAARPGDSEFLADVAYSTFSGYYAIRLIDNLTDRDGPAELPALLPTAGYFHWRFLQPYLKHFPHGHDFWPEFHRVWSDQANATVEDALEPEITEDTFYQVSSRKFGASKVPLAAVAFRHGMPTHLQAWYEFVDVLGAFVQFMNDFLDWRHDDEHEINTFLQSESRRRRAPGETHAEWFGREGCSWGTDRLRLEMRKVSELGRRLSNDDASRWIAVREEVLERQLDRAAANPLATGEGSSSLGDRNSEH
ncbi:MAG: hypothetical protein ABI665_07535 [Vicinamibacterales bacterium]